jgi:hypothetical protein
MRVLDGIAIYPCIDIPYGLNEHPRVDFFNLIHKEIKTIMRFPPYSSLY